MSRAFWIVPTGEIFGFRCLCRGYTHHQLVMRASKVKVSDPYGRTILMVAACQLLFIKRDSGASGVHPNPCIFCMLMPFPDPLFQFFICC